MFTYLQFSETYVVISHGNGWRKVPESDAQSVDVILCG